MEVDVDRDGTTPAAVMRVTGEVDVVGSTHRGGSRLSNASLSSYLAESPCRRAL